MRENDRIRSLCEISVTVEESSYANQIQHMQACAHTARA